MPIYSMPSLNQAYIDSMTSWQETDVNMYHRMPYFMAKVQSQAMEDADPVFAPLLGDLPWKANSGDTGRTITKTRAPRTRQSFNPNRLSTLPKVDAYVPGERQTSFYVYWHIHTTNPMFFYPSFTDFMDHTEDAVQTIADQQARDSELFYRTYMFHQSPAVFLAGRGGSSSLSSIDNEVVQTTGALQGNGDDNWTTAKSIAWLSANLPSISNQIGAGNLSIPNVDLACTYLANQRLRPFRGSGKSMGEDLGVDSTYLLICSDEAFQAFRYDPWLKSNKNITLDVVYNKKFKGNFLGRWTTRIEEYPLRFNVDTTGAVTVPAPELTVVDADAENLGEPIPNPTYLSAQYEVAWLVSGEESYKKVKVGPPPSMFKGKAPKGFGNLTWNGEIEITPNIIISALNSDGNPVQMLNTDGMYVQARAKTTYGVAGTQKRGVLPIIFRRAVGARFAA